MCVAVTGECRGWLSITDNSLPFGNNLSLGLSLLRHSSSVICFHTELRTIWGEKLSRVRRAKMENSFKISNVCGPALSATWKDDPRLRNETFWTLDLNLKYLGEPSSRFSGSEPLSVHHEKGA